MQQQQQFPLGYLLNQAAQPKQVLKAPADERAAPSNSDIRRLKRVDPIAAADAHRERREFIAQKRAESMTPEPPVAMFAPLPPLEPTMDVQDHRYRYRRAPCITG